MPGTCARRVASRLAKVRFAATSRPTTWMSIGAGRPKFRICVTMSAGTNENRTPGNRDGSAMRSAISRVRCPTATSAPVAHFIRGIVEDDLEIQPRAFVVLTDDVRAGLQTLKPRVALYVGGMGHRDKNFHKEMMIRRGFGEAAQRIQELFLTKRKDEAVAAVPDEFCDEMSLVGPVARIRERYKAWADCGITGLTIVADQPEAMELMASLAR